ncbi:MAG: hypothetical protein M3O88_03625, partial [Actinomycetota bacterium]|nr:hypothetical protein [Actinomycetota bacterium]
MSVRVAAWLGAAGPSVEAESGSAASPLAHRGSRRRRGCGGEHPRGPGDRGNGTGGAPFASAAEALNSTAAVAASQPAEAPIAGQYLYTKTEGLAWSVIVGAGSDRSGTLSQTSTSRPFSEESWLSPDGSG